MQGYPKKVMKGSDQMSANPPLLIRQRKQSEKTSQLKEKKERKRMSCLIVYFGSLTIMQNNLVNVWHHPYQETKENENRFTLQNVNYIEYKSFPPVQDCRYL